LKKKRRKNQKNTFFQTSTAYGSDMGSSGTTKALGGLHYHADFERCGKPEQDPCHAPGLIRYHVVTFHGMLQCKAG